MHLVRPFALSLCLALGGHAVAAEPEAEKIKLPLPWKLGQSLKYETERVKTETGPGKREKSLSTSTSEVRTIEADARGFVQEWRSHDAREEVIEGDKAQAEMMAEAVEQLSAIALVVEMEPEGTYRRVRNLAEVGERMRAAMRPVMLKLFLAGVESAAKGADPAKRKEAMDKAPAEVDAFLQRYTEPKLLENLLTNEIQSLLNFSGAELENDQAYELETTLDNPVGGAPFPAKLTFGLYVDEDEPEDVWLEWTLEIDPVKGASAIWDTVEHLYGRKFSEAERKDMPAQVSIVDKGFIVFERASGIPELFQNVRNTKVGENANYERNRMRLLASAHDHQWIEQGPHDTEPELSSDERDAQLCADARADLTAAIASCSRLLERADLEPKERARWHASRAAHRGRMQQHAQAVADYDKAIALQPAQSGYYIGRAGAHGAGGDHQAALADAGKAAGLQPNSAEPELLIGAAHEGLKDYRRASEHFGRAIELAPGDPRGHDARCWSRAMLADFAGAKSDCDRAIELDANRWNSYNSRGYVHYRAGRFSDSVRDYDAAIGGLPEVASSWYVRGLAKRALGDAKGAEADIAKGLALDPKVGERYAGYGAQ